MDEKYEDEDKEILERQVNENFEQEDDQQTIDKDGKDGEDSKDSEDDEDGKDSVDREDGEEFIKNGNGN